MANSNLSGIVFVRSFPNYFGNEIFRAENFITHHTNMSDFPIVNAYHDNAVWSK